MPAFAYIEERKLSSIGDHVFEACGIYTLTHIKILRSSSAPINPYPQGEHMVIKFGIGLGQDQNVHNVAKYAKVAEDLGFHHVTMIDMGTLSQEVTVMMTVASMGTERIKIGHGVTNPATYHPGAIANAMASLRELTNDRAFVGIGAGGPYGQYLNKGVRMSELRESVQFMKDYSAGREGEWRGNRWHNE